MKYSPKNSLRKLELLHLTSVSINIGSQKANSPKIGGTKTSKQTKQIKIIAITHEAFTLKVKFHPLKNTH